MYQSCPAKRRHTQSNVWDYPQCKTSVFSLCGVKRGHFLGIVMSNNMQRVLLTRDTHLWFSVQSFYWSFITWAWSIKLLGIYWTQSPAHFPCSSEVRLILHGSMPQPYNHRCGFSCIVYPILSYLISYLLRPSWTETLLPLEKLQRCGGSHAQTRYKSQLNSLLYNIRLTIRQNNTIRQHVIG